MTTSRFRTVQHVAIALVACIALPVPDAAEVAQPADVRPGAGGQDVLADASHNYVVVLSGEPAAAYRGGVAGYLPSASPGRGFDSTSRAAVVYARYLVSREEAIAASVGATAFYHYTTALNGFAARLTAGQALGLAKRSDVVAVARDELRLADTTHSPQFLGLTGPTGVWRRLGGTDPVRGAGHGIVIGIIDSGIDDEASSFAPAGNGIPDDWHGVCDPGADADFACNDKLIGGRYFDAGATVIPEEIESPDDLNGHGTHVAATAAGRNGVEATIYGVPYGATSGMAPAAKVASYKACWSLPDFTNCSASVSDSVAAIDAAVADGVDVLNYSISGTDSDVVDPVELAFMYAADAGVFVAAAGGNDGPAASTVRHPSPWLTTVAAATHRRDESTVLLGDGTRMVGASLSPVGVDESPLIRARSIPAAGADRADARFCLPGTLDAARAAGAIVICDRGVNLRVEKSETVKVAGGLGMVLVNIDPLGLETDVHAVPTVHLSARFRAPLFAYAATATPTASILAGFADGSPKPAPPAVAFFSSRGPSLAAGGDLLKPDIAAPGFNVVAATSPEGLFGDGNSFAVISGTSMASPHIAGLAALVMQRHPDWSPMAVKSAMMTTATDLTNTANPFHQGAGFVNPRSFLDPGLVYDSDFDDWVDYLAGQGVEVDGQPISQTPLRASNLNVASIAVDHLAARETVSRVVTNVDDTTTTYRASVGGLAGLDVSVRPARLTLQPGQTARFKVTIEQSTAPHGRYAFGSITWRGGGHIVQSRVVVRPVLVDAAPEVSVVDGRATLTVRPGYEGTLGRRVGGLVASLDRAATAENSGQAADPLSDANYFRHVKVTGPSQVVRLATLPEIDGDDLDLYLLDSLGAVVASSASEAGAETVTVTGLPRGLYFVSVEAFELVADRAATTFTLQTWRVGGHDAENLVVRPRAQDVRAGREYRYRLATVGLDPSLGYLGVVRWTRGSGSPAHVVGATVVAVP